MTNVVDPGGVLLAIIRRNFAAKRNGRRSLTVDRQHFRRIVGAALSTAAVSAPRAVFFNYKPARRSRESQLFIDAVDRFS